MKKICLLILLAIPSFAMCQGFGNANLLGGQGKTARDIKRDKAKKRATAAKASAIKKAKAENLSKKISIVGLAGYKFGDKVESVCMKMLDKPCFTRYGYVTLESSPLYGIHAITLTAEDPAIQTEEQIKNEITSMMGKFSAKFGIKFTMDINRYSNEEYGKRIGVSTRCDSIRGNVTGRVLEEQTVVTKPATKITFMASEKFANCVMTFKGVKDLVNNKVTMTVAVTDKFQ